MNFKLTLAFSTMLLNTTRGCVVCHGGTAGTGAAMDQGANLCVKSDSSSANPLGIFLTM